MSAFLQVDASGLERMAELMRRAGAEAPRAIMRAVNWTGDRAYTQVVRALVAQTGAKRNVVVKRVAKRPATLGGRIAYRIQAKSPAMPLSDFDPRLTRRGVSAAPWRTRRVFRHSFM